MQLANIEVEQGLFELMSARLGIAIDASDAHRRETLAQKFFDLFGALTDVINVLAGTGGTLCGRALMVIAIMANQSAIGLMISERNITIRTVDRFAARATQDETRITATIQQDDRLFIASVSLTDGSQKLIGKNRRLLAPGKNLAHVDHLRAVHYAVSEALGQVDIFVLAGLCVVKRFQRRRGRAQHHARGFFLTSH